MTNVRHCRWVIFYAYVLIQFSKKDVENCYEDFEKFSLMPKHTFGCIKTVTERDRRMERQTNGSWDIDDEDIPIENEDVE